MFSPFGIYISTEPPVYPVLISLEIIPLNIWILLFVGIKLPLESLLLSSFFTKKCVLKIPNAKEDKVG